MLTVDFIGAGNVATRMATGLHRSGVKVRHIASRSTESARTLAGATKATAVPIDSIGRGASMVIVAVNDDAIRTILDMAQPQDNDTVWVHTSGSVGMDVFDPVKFPRHGVFYPLQTMSRGLDVDWSRVPLFTEGSSAETESMITDTARLLTPRVTHLSSDKRRQLHAAAVIGCNMAVYLWSLSETVMREAGLDFEMMRPLLEVTLERTRSLPPTEAMTGPARRGDLHTVEGHMRSLPPQIAGVYGFLSWEILKIYHPELTDRIYEQN